MSGVYVYVVYMSGVYMSGVYVGGSGFSMEKLKIRMKAICHDIQLIVA